MPICRCPECGLVVAWLGKQFAFSCPGDHPSGQSSTLDVDRHHARPNGTGYDGSRPRVGGGDPAGSDGVDWLAVNRAKGNRT